MSAAPPLPFRLGGFGTIVADYAWHYDDQSGRMKLPYESMTDEECLEFSIGLQGLAAQRGHLYFWTDDAHLELALACIPRCGYVFKKTIVWVKTLDEPYELRQAIRAAACSERWGEFAELVDRIGKVKIGGGHYLRGAHELCLFATRGGLTGLVRDVPSVIFAPHPRDEAGRIIHSAKPEELQDIAERLSPGPRIELFARRARNGWTIWGAQAPTENACSSEAVMS